ncbi:MAG: TIM barrel protein [Clostridia bacterium]
MANVKANFGPGGNSASFYAEGNKSTLKAPEWVKSKGLDAYEYQGGKGIFASESTLTEIGKNAKHNKIKMSLHAPYYISLSSVTAEIREKSIDYILSSAKSADLLGANIFVVHSGSAAKLDREAAMIFAEETLAKAAEALENSGCSALMGLETMGKVNQLGTLDEVIRLCKINTDVFRPVVDFGHLNARTCGGIVTEDDYKNIFEKIASELSPEFAENLHCHFSKIEYTKMGEKKHLTFADETFGPSYELLAKAIAALGISPTIICESDGTMAEDATTLKQQYIKYL